MMNALKPLITGLKGVHREQAFLNNNTLLLFLFVLSCLGCGKDSTTVEEEDFGRPVSSAYELVHFRFVEVHDHSYEGERTYPAWQGIDSLIDGTPWFRLNRDSVRMWPVAYTPGSVVYSLSAWHKSVQEQGGTDTVRTLVSVWPVNGPGWEVWGTVTLGASFRFLTAHSVDPGNGASGSLMGPDGKFNGYWPLPGTYTVHGDTLSYAWVRRAWEDPNPPWQVSYTAKYVRR